MMPVAWGQTLVEAQFMAWLYRGVCGLQPQEEACECVTNENADR